MIALGPLLLLLHAAAVPPVLELPEPGLDDTSAYQGYRTRIFRDSHDNAVQRARHLKLLADTSLESLRSRLHPAARLLRGDSAWIVRVEQPSFDGKNQLVLELRGSAKTSSVEPGQSAIVIRPRAAGPFTLAVTVTTDAAPLTPIDRNRIFTPGFLAFCARGQR